jgi:16S rRNA G1207 methylase RsmC
MARLVNRIARESGCDKVVDVGAGKGHLSRVLALHYGYV